MQTITKNLQIKKPLTLEQKAELLKEISDADLIIGKKEEELKAAKEVIKSQIEVQVGIRASACAKYRLGYEAETIECSVKYFDGKATYTNSKTGEIVQESDITDQEQLMLSEHRIDAESIIREDSKRQDE